MNQFKYKLMQFMAGRNGVDPLGYATLALYFAVFAVNSFVHTIVLTILGYLIVLLTLYRMFSKDVLRRRRENAWFMGLFNRVKAFVQRTARRLKDIRTHRYRTCPHCKVTLRLPKKRGKNTVICPRCKQRIHVRVWI